VTGGGERPARAPVAAGALKLEAARAWRCRRGREQPRQRSGDAGALAASATQARREGIAQANECQMPRDSKTVGSRMVPGRRSSVAASFRGRCSYAPFIRCGARGRVEGLRRTHGDAVGVKLDPVPVNRDTVNVGSVLGSPSLLGSRPGSGQAHRRLLAWGRGRALVVVRARESRAHGEGGQQVCNAEWSLGGRR
jgi:hypothetical protein